MTLERDHGQSHHVSIRAAREADLRAIALVHTRAFRGFFLTALGDRFLRAYYGLTLTHAGAILAVAAEDHHILGFVSGFLQPDLFYAAIARCKWRLAVPVALGALRHPGTIPRIIHAARHVRGGQAAKAPWQGTAAELASIAVDPVHAGTGLGRRLLGYFVDAAAEAGADYVYLTTDARDNDSVNAFYARNGFTLVNSFAAAANRQMNLYARRTKTESDSNETCSTF
ncbi:MAG: GNAT family N-acetyltransferase [candidate division WS1 bacterium]|jgi:ribosomal protein S18 acetylase RimI-like enzyme|nr:GNAT family N-acetyltransferase [candidate division WS1 bacterium]